MLSLRTYMVRNLQKSMLVSKDNSGRDLQSKYNSSALFIGKSHVSIDTKLKFFQLQPAIKLVVVYPTTLRKYCIALNRDIIMYVSCRKNGEL